MILALLLGLGTAQARESNNKPDIETITQMERSKQLALVRVEHTIATTELRAWRTQVEARPPVAVAVAMNTPELTELLQTLNHRKAELLEVASIFGEKMPQHITAKAKLTDAEQALSDQIELSLAARQINIAILEEVRSALEAESVSAR